jgi:hypothetical protein
MEQDHIIRSNGEISSHHCKTKRGYVHVAIEAEALVQSHDGGGRTWVDDDHYILDRKRSQPLHLHERIHFRWKN